MSEKAKWKFKITLFGPGAVGKTSLIIRFIKESFADSLKKTIGTNFLIKDIWLPGEGGDKDLARLLIWDIGGQSAFSSMRDIYFKGSNAAIGVYDVTAPDTLLKIPGWVSSIKKAVGNIPMILIGNKIDLDRKVDREEAEDLAKRLNCEYLETSAKTGENVDDAFTMITEKCVQIATSED